jgi:amino acid adenylation domain-containing protein
MDSPTPPFMTVAHAIMHRLHAYPDGCAIRFRGISISNAALLCAVLGLAEGLRVSGIGAGTRVGVCFERNPATPALLLALWWRGAVYVPLDPALPRERLFAMCEIAELDILVTQANLQRTVEALPCPVLLLDMPLFDAATVPTTPPPPDAPVDTAALAYVLFTSGSSGAPKGVMISHGNLADLFAGALPLLGLKENCRILGCASFSFDIAFFELLAPLLCGGTLVLAEASSCSAPLQLLELIVQEQVTVVQATPSHWQLLIALPWPQSLALALSTGEALLRDTAARILQRADALWNLYGPTECTIWASAYRVTAQDLLGAAPAIVSIGSALPGYTLHLEPAQSDDGAPVEELIIGGAGVGLGYCTGQDSIAFRQSGTGRRYRSGDLCRLDAEGRFHYGGRRDNQIKHNGYRIEPEEIALLLRQHMSIRQAACLVRTASSDCPSLLFACVVFRRGMPNRNKQVLNEYLATYLPGWMLPQRYFFLDELPLNVNGKLDRAALLALIAPETGSTQGTTLEARVAAIFCEVLDVASIGPRDSFLDAGGSSMLAATLVMTLNERLGATLTLRQTLATPPTVAGIAQLLRVGALSEAS